MKYYKRESKLSNPEDYNFLSRKKPNKNKIKIREDNVN